MNKFMVLIVFIFSVYSGIGFAQEDGSTGTFLEESTTDEALVEDSASAVLIEDPSSPQTLEVMSERNSSQYKVPIHQMAENDLARINKGHWQLGGSLGLSYSSFNGAQFTINPQAQYFFKDHISVGGTFIYSKSNNLEVLGVGPSGTYYFWTKDQLAAFFSQSFMLTNYEFSNTYSSANNSELFFNGTSTVGINYFMTPSVAFGASFNYNYGLDNKSALDNNAANLRGEFAIFF